MTDTKKLQNRGCLAVMGTLTNAQKAQNALAKVAIPSSVTKVDASAGHGCMWSINFSCAQRANVERVLSSARIGVKSWEYST